MPEEIGLFEAIHTQRAIRQLKPDPVPDELINKLLSAAIRAPSGANSQPWTFIVVKDPETRRRLKEVYFSPVPPAHTTSPTPALPYEPSPILPARCPWLGQTYAQ